MYAVTDTFKEALRRSHTAYIRVEAWLNGVLVNGNLPISDGQVAVNSGTGVRRQLDVTVTDRDLWDTLSPVGTELIAYRGIQYPNGSREVVPLGIFGIDSQSMSVGPEGGISISSAPDRWAQVQRARFETPAASIKGATHKSEASRLISAAVSGISVTVTATSTATVGALTWDRDRDAAINDLVKAIAAEAYFDNSGNAVVKDAPLLSAVPVWTVDASPSGVLLGGDRSRSREQTYNVVIVAAASVDGVTPFATQTIEDDDPTSPTFVDDYGRVPYFISSPLITTTGQAQTVGTTILNKVKGLNAQINVEAVCNPALDRGDVIWVVTPELVTERHIIDAVTVPLTVGGTQGITTRSSRPDGDVPAEE